MQGRHGSNQYQQKGGGNISTSSDDAGKTRDIAAAKAGLGSGKTLEAAMEQIPDNAFDDHPEVIDLRSKLADATAELKFSKAARAKIDKNPTPARIAELSAEIARREPALRAAEAEAKPPKLRRSSANAVSARGYSISKPTRLRPWLGACVASEARLRKDEAPCRSVSKGGFWSQHPSELQRDGHSSEQPIRGRPSGLAPTAQTHPHDHGRLALCVVSGCGPGA